MVLTTDLISFLQDDNLSPIANDDSSSTFEDESLFGNVLTNDSDPEGQQITITSVNGFTDAIGVPLFLPSGAIVILDADGSYYYDPNERFDALTDGETASDSFEYTVSDPGGASSNAGSRVTINGKSLQSSHPPNVVNDTGIVRKNEVLSGNVLQNDSDPDGSRLAVRAVNGLDFTHDVNFVTSLGAKVTILATGDYIYNPNGVFNNLLEGQTATDSFTYTAFNNGNFQATANVSITIVGVNDVPPGFDAAQYGASNPDLIPIYRNDLAGLTTHYLLHGRAENRPIDNFDEFRYIASSYTTGNDLINAFGLNGEAATLQYLTNGFFERRSTTAFDPARYLDSYDDLRNNLGTNLVAASQHFIATGHLENRNPNLFPSDRYIASYGDLINLYHYNLEEGSKHYLYSGRSEGRQITFDPLAYLARNPDIAAAYNNDPTLATFHYITHGFAEGRPAA